jgi:Tol biopolymer transport system component
LVRFTLKDPLRQYDALWEMEADGENLRPLLPDWKHSGLWWGEGECCGVWTPDGKYFLFRSRPMGLAGIWAIPQGQGWLRPANTKPVELFTTPLSISPPALSKDGRRMFFVGARGARDLVRFDLKARRFLPTLAGLPICCVSYSADGQWLTYDSKIDDTLWKSRADGGRAVQLTFPPLRVVDEAAWSPDGRSLLFTGRLPTGQSKLFLIPPDGGTARCLTPSGFKDSDPSWSADGKTVLCRRETVPNGSGPPKQGVYVWMPGSSQSDLIPGSEELERPRWSRDGRYVAGVTQKGRRIMLFDLHTRQWVVIAEANYINGPFWSRDSMYVYFQDFYQGGDEPSYRYEIATRRIETLTSYERIGDADILAYTLTGVAPDGSPLAMLIHKSGDIYALDLNLP